MCFGARLSGPQRAASQTKLSNYATPLSRGRRCGWDTRAPVRAVTNRAVALENKAIGELNRMDGLVAMNVAPSQTAVSNVLRFYEQLNKVGADLQDTVGSNRSSVQAALRNLETASGQVTNLLGDVPSGRGVAGAQLMSNLNTHGLFYRVFYRPKPTNSEPVQPLPTPRMKSQLR